MSLLKTRQRVTAAQKDRKGYPLIPIRALSLNNSQENFRVGSEATSIKVSGCGAMVGIVASHAPLHVEAHHGANVTVFHGEGPVTIVCRGGARVSFLSIGGEANLLSNGGDINAEVLFTEVRGKSKKGQLQVSTGTGKVDVQGNYKKIKLPLPRGGEF